MHIPFIWFASFCMHHVYVYRLYINKSTNSIFACVRIFLMIFSIHFNNPTLEADRPIGRNQLFQWLHGAFGIALGWSLQLIWYCSFALWLANISASIENGHPFCQYWSLAVVRCTSKCTFRYNVSMLTGLFNNLALLLAFVVTDSTFQIMHKM